MSSSNKGHGEKSGDKECSVGFQWKDVSGKALVTHKLRHGKSRGSRVDMWKKSVQPRRQEGQCGWSTVNEEGRGAERVEMRSEGQWGAGSCNAIKALVEGLLLTSCLKFPVLLRLPTRILSDIAALPIES